MRDFNPLQRVQLLKKVMSDIRAYSYITLLRQDIPDRISFQRLYPYDVALIEGEEQSVIFIDELLGVSKYYDGLVPGMYVVNGGELGCGLFSMTEFNQEYDKWLDQLCQGVVGVSLERLRNNPTWFEQVPFYPLFVTDRFRNPYFGPVTSGKLAVDFEACKDLALEVKDIDFICAYRQLWKLFEVARSEGVVSFI